MRFFTSRWICLVLLMALLASRYTSVVYAQATSNTFTGHVVTVTAGDTMDVRVGDDWTVTVRLHGIECPATPRALRETTARYTARLVLDTDVRVEVRGTATRSVVYGEVYPKAGGPSVNVTLTRVGLATWSRQYAPTRSDIGDAESKAQSERLGIWGADDGSNITLPPSATETAKPGADSKKSTVQKTPTKRSPRAVAPKTTAKPNPIKPPVTVRAATAKPTTWPRLPLPIGLVCFFFALLALLGYATQHRLLLTSRRIVAQLILALIGGIAGALIGLLPFSYLPSALSDPKATLPLVAALVLPLVATMLLREGTILASTAQRLLGRSIDPREANPGFVKLHGVAQTATDELVFSNIGNVPGLYIREVTTRYTAETPDGKRLASARWTSVGNRVAAVDIRLHSGVGDGTGEALVLAAQEEETPHEIAPARWIPYHVARFYNDVPTDAWYATAYEGDTRTEIFFIPNGATLTVWGNLYPPDPAQTSTEFPLPRIAPDPMTGTLLIVDGPEQRAYSGPRTASVTGGIAAFLIGTLCALGAIAGTISGGFIAMLCSLAMLGVSIGIILLLAIRRGAALAQRAETEWTSGETDPLRRPATIAQEEYRRGFPGMLIGTAVGE